jgi:hypothetical protein
MWKILAVVIGLAGTTLTGCITGANPYRSVDLSQNLDQVTLDRYESEWKALQAAGHTEPMVQLEHSNWWPLGLIAYHRDCSVTRMAGPNGPVYMIQSGHGFAPLCIIYSIDTCAKYTAKGERIDWMRMQASLKGCLFMGHQTDAKLADGSETCSSSWHLVMHNFNYHAMDGHAYYSLFTVPNPIGVATTSDH